MSRTRASAKKAGTSWETEIVNELIAHGWPYAERRRLSGALDKGDIAGVAGVCIEAKNAARIELAQWLDEVTREKNNAGAAVGAVWMKRRGRSRAAQGYVLLDGATFMQLLKEAGYQ